MLFRFTYACLVFFFLSIVSSGSSKKHSSSWYKRVKVVKGDTEEQVVIASGLGKGSGQNKLFKRTKEVNKEKVDDKGDGIEDTESALYIPGNKEKLEDADNKTKHNDETSEIDGNVDSDVAIYIPGKKSKLKDDDNLERHDKTSEIDSNIDSDVAIYIPGKKDKEGDDNQAKHDKTSEIDANVDSDVAIYIPGKTSEDNNNASQLSDKNSSGNIEPEGTLHIPDNKKLDNQSKADKSLENKNGDKVKNNIEDVNLKAKDMTSDEGKTSNVQENVFTSWPLGVIPYYFDMTSIDNILANRIRESMEIIEGESCIQFKQLTAKPDGKRNWIHITTSAKDRACVHRGMHRTSGEIRMSLGVDCLKRRNILHALLHAMGFADEVTHPYRDHYIHIIWENIQPKYQSLFSISSPGEISSHVEYDPMSIMHFHERAFSKNGRATIVPVMPGLRILPSDKLSQLDKMKLRLAFSHECNRRSVDRVVDTCKVVLQDKVENNVSNKEINNEESIKDEVVENKLVGENKNVTEHEKQVLVKIKESNDNKERKDNRESKISKDGKVGINQTEKKENEHHESKENESKSNINADSKLEVKEKENPLVSNEPIITVEENGQGKYAVRAFRSQFKKSYEGKQSKNDKPFSHILSAHKNVVSSHSNNKDGLFFLIHSGQFKKSRVKGEQDNKETFFRTLPSAAKNKTGHKRSNSDRLFLNPGQRVEKKNKSRKRNEIKLNKTNKSLSKDPKRMQTREKKFFRKNNIKHHLN